jgi:hypothetical protein
MVLLIELPRSLQRGQHIVGRQWPPDPLQLELTHWLDLHGVLDLRQHPRATRDLPMLAYIGENAIAMAAGLQQQ